ncbi:disease resistance protein RGA2-like [Oryza glaberrima]|uniref:disease resistance protein RGA2-like n=1 Tax=Oryza glaberrima TaxID=4538 RepID=UPI00224C1F20|nr:disease resistance protein RGA2-like [Oryza glaberrima]
MEVALRTAGWLVGKLVDLLSAELLEALDNSYNLGANAHAIKAELLYTQGLLHKAQDRNVAHSPELAGLLLQLSHLAEDADNVLDKVDYYRIRDEVRGGRGFIRRFATHAGHSLGKCRRSLTSSLSCRDIAAAATATATTGPRPVEAEFFNRSIESERMKSLMAQMQPLCAKISDFLKFEVMDPKHSTTALNTAAAFSERVTTTTSTSLEAKLQGRDLELYAAAKEIISGRDGLTVLPVLGPGGSGKTTFTQHLYHAVRVKKHFHVRIWVHVSLNFDVLRLTREIFNSLIAGELRGRQGRISNIEEPHNLEQLHIQLEQMLQSKRFLLVLDDMWSCDSEYKWDKFLAPFRKTMVKGSTVIVTTRFDKIAKMVKSGTELPISLDRLDPEAFWALFLACAFGDEKPEHHKELLDLGREIVKKLGSSPLAAKTVGRLLKKDLTRGHWSRVLESKEWEHGENVNDIMPALKLSYDCLPFHLQKCFTFCALFPDDYQYQDSELTHLWSALGVITCSGQDGTIQHIGLQYINELVL